MRAVLSLTAVLLVAGCNDPYRWSGHWDASQANQLNLAAQAADWHDLDVGHGDPGSDGQEAAAAVDRLRHDAVKPLAAGTVADLTTPSNAAPAAPATPAASSGL